MVLTTLLYTAALARLSISATLIPPLANETASERLGLQWMGNDTSLPKILVLFTGGTIVSGSDLGALDDTQYSGFSLTGEELIDRNPYLQSVAQLAVSNWMSEDGSTGTNDALVLNMTRFAHDALCSPDSDITGAVFTHGTNSLEETAFLMDLLVNCGKPIVGAGAMRPWTALGYDGDANFFQAVSLAADDDARDRSVMVAFSNRILPGFWVTKLHANHVDAFHSTTGGDLGSFLNMRPYFFNSPSTPYQKHEFNISVVSADSSYPSLPRVDMLFAAREFDGDLILDCYNRGARGIVIAGTGSGSVPGSADQVAEALERGLRIVVATRSPYGAATPARVPTFARSGYVQEIQSRIMLQLAIASGFNQNQTIELFEGTLRKTIGQPFVY